AHELGLLFEVSQILDQSLDLKRIMNPVLETLAKHLALQHATLTLLNRETGEIIIECAHGLSSQQASQGRYQMGEGVTGKVVQSGRPQIIAKTSESPHFVNRTRRLGKKEFSFVCVPVKLGREVIGALS
ncbi:MAG TPA: GAF domain-containing protein, partial [Oligoflexia bacterium]|nr:GAF domain-containing protein [Oligoflexia bacterium]